MDDIKALTFCKKCLMNGLYSYIDTGNLVYLKGIIKFIKNSLVGLSKMIGVSIPAKNLEHLAFGDIVASKVARETKQDGNELSQFARNYIKSSIEALTCSNLKDEPEIQKFLVHSKICILDLELLISSLQNQFSGNRKAK